MNREIKRFILVWNGANIVVEWGRYFPVETLMEPLLSMLGDKALVAIVIFDTLRNLTVLFREYSR